MSTVPVGASESASMFAVKERSCSRSHALSLCVCACLSACVSVRAAVYCKLKLVLLSLLRSRFHTRSFGKCQCSCSMRSRSHLLYILGVLLLGLRHAQQLVYFFTHLGICLAAPSASGLSLALALSLSSRSLSVWESLVCRTRFMCVCVCDRNANDKMPMVAQAQAQARSRSLPAAAAGAGAGVTSPLQVRTGILPGRGGEGISWGFTNRLADRSRGVVAEGGTAIYYSKPAQTAPQLGFYFCASFYYAFIIIFEQSQKLFNFINGPPNTHTYTRTEVVKVMAAILFWRKLLE